MATYLKRTSKLFDLSLIRKSNEVNLRDLICPVCRGILIEPVTLPCSHNLCLRCLKGTFEHNSLSCPLCRVRVGSWLRTATKSETLVNSTLWELIRTRFPKEVEGKRKGDEGDIELDSGFTSKKIILSAAGEIRREYEVQLKIAEDEIRQQRENERLANVALIRKIHAEDEQEKFLQIDRNMAKSLTTTRRNKKYDDKTNPMKYYTEYGAKNCVKILETCEKTRTMNFNENSTINLCMEKKNGDKTEKPEIMTINKRTNLSCMTKINDEKMLCCEKIQISNNASGGIVARNVKNRTVGRYTNSSNFTTEAAATAGCSGTRIYGTRSKEELHVPIDLLSSKKKILGVEICVNQSDKDERIGSAESAGSHDSINQEIHHFKPIKPIARTSLKISQDGKPIDPKLVRVIPIVKRVTNAVPKPPSPTHLMRILGCSWSAFRGKARQNLELLRTAQNADLENDANTSMASLQQSIASGKSQLLSETAARRLDLTTEISFDTNKNYSKGINRIINGTRVSKKLILDETSVVEPARTGRIKKMQNIPRNIATTVARSKKILYNEKKKLRSNDEEDEDEDEDENENEDENDEKKSSSSRSSSTENLDSAITKERENDCDVTIENIAERIKRRKIRDKPEKFSIIVEPEEMEIREKRKTRGRNTFAQTTTTTKQTVENSQKRRKFVNPMDIADSTRNSVKNITCQDEKTMGKDLITKKLDDDITERGICENTKKATNNSDIDVKIIEEQTRMERLIIQEKKDFELAMRLQSQYDDMERIAGRTRGSRRAMERGSVETNNFQLGKLDVNGEKRRDETGNRKQRRRPQKHAVK